MYYSLLALSRFVKNDMNFITTDDEKKMLESIRYLKTLSPDLHVLPGHGPDSTIGNERIMNPYMNM